MNEKEAVRKVQVYGFALTDAGLFLDTHPGDRAALEFYRETERKYTEAAEDYGKQFGPLTLMGRNGKKDPNDTEDPGKAKEWNWVKEPWPWEA